MHVTSFFFTLSLEFDLGKLQSGKVIDDVELPAWAESPEHFIIKHREALVYVVVLLALLHATHKELWVRRNCICVYVHRYIHSSI